MGIARRIAHTTYRHEAELDDRFGRRPRAGEDPLGGGGRYDVESYLDHHAAKLARRFDPNSYVVLTEAMNSHDVGRGRGGVAAALRTRHRRELHVVGRRRPTGCTRCGCPRRSPPACRSDAAVGHRVRHGHDGFLVETEQVGAHVSDARALIGGRGGRLAARLRPCASRRRSGRSPRGPAALHARRS